jgi:hypothetical protein
MRALRCSGVNLAMRSRAALLRVAEISAADFFTYFRGTDPSLKQILKLLFYDALHRGVTGRFVLDLRITAG